MYLNGGNNVRVSVFRTAICAVIFAVAGRAAAQEAKPEYKFEFHGFVGGSVYAQDFVANNQGGGAFYVAGSPSQDKGIFSADVRQTRLVWSLSGPKVFGGATPKAYAAVDFFGQVNSGAVTVTTLGTSASFTASTNAFTNLTPRIRAAIAELNWGSTVLQFGQENDLTLHVTPTSVGHIPQSLTYDAGSIGARHAGIFAYHNLALPEDMKLELGLQVTRSAYNDGTGAGMTGTQLSTAEASALPMVAARAKLKHKIFEFSATGLWNQVDLSGVNQGDSGGLTRDVIVGVVAAKVSYMGVTVQGSGYAGKNTAQFTPSFGQYAPATTSGTTQAGDLHDWGAWVQAGYNITPEFSAWVLGGVERMNPTEIRDSGNNKWGNSLVTAMLRYMEGGYAIGLEYAHFETMYLDRKSDGTTGIPAGSARASPNGVLAGNQVMLSGFYFF